MRTTPDAEPQATHRRTALATRGLRLAVVALLAVATAACGNGAGEATAGNRPPAATASPAAPSISNPATSRATTPPRPTLPAPSPSQVATPPQAPEPQVSPGVANATRSARSYLDYTGFSRTGLIEQLEYEGYTTDEATTAVDGMDVDYDAEAVESARSYLDYTSFSRSGLIDQLEYEGFTPAQAEYGVSQTYGG